MFLYLSIFCLFGHSYAQHDHSLHVDAKFVHGEALRTAWLTKQEMLEYIEDYVSALTHIAYTYDTLYELPANHP